LWKQAEANRDPDSRIVAACLGQSCPERLAVVPSEGTRSRAEGDRGPAVNGAS
jgi:hypothetical protein